MHLMPAVFLSILLFLYCSCTCSQTPVTLSHKDSSTAWLDALYAKEVSTAHVQQLFDAYYRQHPFIKNKHTQYFKRLKRTEARFPAYHLMDSMQKANFREHKKSYISKSKELAELKSNNPLWTSLGPFNFDKTAASTSYACGAAHVYCVEQAPSDSDIIYAGTATAGVWKSIDKGLNWTACTNNEWITRVKAIAVHPTNAQIVYAASDLDYKLYKTTDAGQQWQIIGDTFFNTFAHSISDIKILAQQSNTLLVASTQGLFRSIDAGSNWQLIDSAAFQEIELHPYQDSIIYAIKQVGKRTEFYKSTDYGQSFVHKPNGWPVPDPVFDEQLRTEIAVSAADSNRIYALLSGAVGLLSGLYGIYVSNDAGETWTSSCCGAHMPNYLSPSNPNLLHWYDDGSGNGGQYYYDLALDVSPTNADSVLVAGVNLWISGDGASSFSCPAQWNHSYKDNYVHADIHDIKMLDGRILIACDGGVFISEDNASTFQVRMKGIQGTDFWGFGASNQYPDVMLGGTFHNGTMLKNGNVYIDDWLSTDGGDNYRGYTHPFYADEVISDFGKKKLYGDRTIANTNFPFLHLPHVGITTGFSGNIAYDPHCYNTLYSTDYYNLWKSTDNGISWAMIHSFNNGLITSLRVSSVNPAIMYLNYHPDGAWDDRKIMRTNDSGYNWNDVTPDSSIITQHRWVTYDIALSATDSNLLWAARTSKYEGLPDLNGQQVYQSEDGGQSWQNITASGLDGVYSTKLVALQGTNKGLYLGTRNAVYYKNDTMQQWQLCNNGLPLRTHAVNLIPNYRIGKLRNASNRSVYESSFVDATAPIAKIAVDKKTVNCPADSFYFASLSMARASANYQWYFEQGQPAISTDQNPVVVFPDTGLFAVQLIVTDSFGTDTLLLDDFIKVNNDCKMDTVAGYALQLTTNNDFLITEPLNYTGNELTITAWIKPDTIQASNTGIVTHADDSKPAGLILGDNNELIFQWLGAQWNWHSGLFVPVDTWSHVAVVIRPSGACLYLNGDSSVYASNLLSLNWSDGVVIGRYANWSSRNFSGQIEEVCLWDTVLTTTQIRSGMHLTNYEQTSNHLMHYYQFNALGPQVLDRKGTLHAQFRGAAGRILSTAAVGGGSSALRWIDSSGTYSFEEAMARLIYGAMQTDAAIVVTRLNVPPDYIPKAYLYSNGYWIINNYGQAQVQMDSIMLWGSNSLDNNNPNHLVLGSRFERGESSSWNINYDSLRFVSGVNLLFSSPFQNNMRAGQLAILSDSMPLLLNKEKTQLILPRGHVLYPNPSRQYHELRVVASQSDKYILSIYNMGGTCIKEISFEGKACNFRLPENNSGIFVYLLKGKQTMYSGKIVRWSQ